MHPNTLDMLSTSDQFVQLVLHLFKELTSNLLWKPIIKKVDSHKSMQKVSS